MAKGTSKFRWRARRIPVGGYLGVRTASREVCELEDRGEKQVSEYNAERDLSGVEEGLPAS